MKAEIPTLGSVLRDCIDIGMFAIDRSREDSCVHKTAFCDASCFNNKLEVAFGHAITPKDQKNDLAWFDNDVESLVATLSRKKKQTLRARLMTRGEAFKDFSDIDRVANILKSTPNTIWWIPTRSWRNPILFSNVRSMVAKFDNVRLLASTDPTTTDMEYAALERKGISTMFYGDDDRTETPDGTRMFKCPKTHKHLVGHCAICKGGCFRKDKPVHVHLKQH